MFPGPTMISDPHPGKFFNDFPGGYARRLSPPSASKKRGEKSKRGEGVPAVVSKARSPLKRADGDEIVSPPRHKKKEESSDDEDGRDAAAELSREA